MEVEALLFPVRFDAFDAGTVEARLAPLLKSGALGLLATVSMGRDHFDLERFPGGAVPRKRRTTLESSPAPAPRSPSCSAGRRAPGRAGICRILPPVTALQSGAGPYEIRDNRRVSTLERGTFDAESLAELEGLTAVRGGGGGYLSNEISYRSVRLAQAPKPYARGAHPHASAGGLR